MRKQSFVPLRRRVLVRLQRILPSFQPDAAGTTAGLSHTRLARGSHTVRMIVGLSALGLARFLPDATPDQRNQFLVLVAAVYVPFAFVLFLVGRRFDSSLIRLVSVVGDLAIVAMFHMVVPQTRLIGLFGYLLILVFHSYLGGIGVGLGVAAAVMGLILLAQSVLPSSDRFDVYTLGMYASVLVSMSVLIHVVTTEQRRASVRLRRLHESLQAVTSSEGLEPMLESVAASACQALGASLTAVALLDNDSLDVAAIWAPMIHRRERDKLYPSLESEIVETSKSALDQRRVTIEPNIATLPDLAAIKRLGLGTVVATPLCKQDSVIGVLSIYFSRPNAATDEVEEFITSYSTQAAAAIQRAAAQESELKAAAKLRALDKMKDEFLDTVSHELRTPLTVIVGFAQTLLGNWQRFQDEGRVEAVGRIAQQADEMQLLVEQLLDLSRMRSSGLDVTPVNLELSATVDGILSRLGPLLMDHPLVIEVPLDLMVFADRDALERILSNLVTNASKYSPKGAEITVTAEAEDDRIVVKVKDRGAGISPDEQKRIFQRFYRGAGVSGLRGAGIGLTVAKHYATIQGGDIWVESFPGKGSTFLVSVPKPAKPAA